MSVNVSSVGEHSHAKPVTVSSTSSMETAASLHSERINMIGTQQVSSAPSLIRSTPQFATQRVSPTPTSSGALPSSISLVHNPLRSPTTGSVITAASPNAVPEFLYQLTKMLTDNNRDIIEWSGGKIEVHNPHKLESHVLNRYFRHSKFASFQRQLNYFGFRKLAGKGKMAPCSYVNDGTTNELRSLLHIKRKTGNEPKSKTVVENKKRTPTSVARSVAGGSARTSQADESTSSQAPSDNNNSTPQHTQQQAIARVAVGKGIRHGFSMPAAAQSISGIRPSSSSSSSIVPKNVQSSLNDLQTNYQTSLQQDRSTGTTAATTTTTSSGTLAYVPGSLRRDDSLVDLAMIPMSDVVDLDQHGNAGSSMPFIDFWDTGIFQDEGDDTLT